jgi:hypothetical protein
VSREEAERKSGGTSNQESEMKTFSERKSQLKLVRRLRNVSIVVVLGATVAVAAALPTMRHHEAAVTPQHEAIVTTPADYFPAQFPAPKGEPEAQVEAF